jgi:hypothetical protein
MAVAEMRIDQVGLPAGTNGRTRSDGLATGAVVTLTATNPGATTATFSLLWIPIGDTTAVPTLAVTGNPLVWTFTPTAGCPGTYRIRLVTNVGLPDESEVTTRLFRVRTPAGLAIPAFNEVADPLASLINSGPAFVAASEDNEFVAGSPGTIGTYDYTGWFRSWHELVMAVGGANAVIIDIRKFGAVAGSGSYATANTIAIQAAIAASNSTGLPIFIPPGEWYSNELTLSGTEAFVGAGSAVSILRYAKTTGDFLSYVSPSTTMAGTYFRALALKGGGQNTGTAVGYRGRIAGSPSLDNTLTSFQSCKVSDFPTGLIFNDSHNIELLDSEILNNGNVGALTGGGVQFQRITFAAVASLANRVSNCRIAGNSRGIFTDNDVLDSLMNLTCDTVVFDANSYGIWCAKSEALKLIGCSFANHVTKAVHATQLLTIKSTQPAATLATTDAWEISDQLIEFSADLFRVAFGATDVFSAKATSSDQWATMIAQNGGLKIGTSGNVRFYSNNGTPEGVLAADKGSLCLDYAAANERLMVYVKTTNTVNTGWKIFAYTPLFGTTGARPAANSLPIGSTYFNTSTLQGEVTDGTDWRQYNGQLLTSGLLASIPAASIDGARYWATDMNQLMLNDGGTYRTLWSVQEYVFFTNAGSYTFPSPRGGRVVNTNDGSISTFTINLPSVSASLQDGDECEIESAGQITDITFSSSINFNYRPEFIRRNSTIRFRYIKSIDTWMLMLASSPFDVQVIQDTGLISGGVVTIDAITSRFDVSAGFGQIVDHTLNPPSIQPISWGMANSQTLSGLATNAQTWIGIDTASSIVQQATPFTLAQRRVIVPLAKISHVNNTSIDNITPVTQLAYNKGFDLASFFEIFGPVNLSGNVWSANGANLQLNKTAGSSWLAGANYSTAREYPSITTDASATAASFRYVYRNPSSPSGYTITAAATSIAPGSWDNGSGTLQSVAAAEWTTQWIYLVPGGINPEYRVVYGQKIYTTKAAAIAGIAADTFAVPTILSGAVLCARLVLIGNATALNNTAQAEFYPAGKFGSQLAGGGAGAAGEFNTMSNVGAGVGLYHQKTGVDFELRTLAGLGGLTIANPGSFPANTLVNLDATALLPRDGSRAMTAELDMGAFALKRLGYNLISPATITATQHDYTATDFDKADIIRFSFTGSQAFTGFLATGLLTTRKILINTDASDSFTINNNNGGSATANQVLCPGGTDLVVGPGGAVLLSYDSTSTKWRAFPLMGEVNTTSNAGASGTGIALAKNGFDLPFAKILGTNGIGESLASNILSISGIALLPLDGSRTMTGTLALGGNRIAGQGQYTITPTALAAQADNYTPTDWSIADVIRQAATGAQTITGFGALSSTAGTILKLFINVGSSIITLANEVTSSGINRILCPNSQDLAVAPNEAVILLYDIASSRWRATPSNWIRTFNQLSDVPSSKAGSAGMAPFVNAGATALAYKGIPGTFCFSVPANYNSGAGVSAAPRQTIAPAVTNWVPATMRARLNTAAGANLTIDIKANGTSIISGSLPIITSGNTTITANLVTTPLVAGDIISVETIGSDTVWAGLEIEAYGSLRIT